LLRIAHANASLFCDTASAAYADVTDRGNRITWPLASPEFAEWLLHAFYRDKAKVPSTTSMNSALRTLRAQARFESRERHEVRLRVAERDGKIYLDLGDPSWRVVEIDVDGWGVVDRAPVRFRRTAGMAALPLPRRGGSIQQLKKFVSLDQPSFILLGSTIVDAYRINRPHPVVHLIGPEGSAKSTTMKVVLSLIDPSSAVDLPALPDTARELFVDAGNRCVVVYDNLSSLAPSMSDALCLISSGGGSRRRKLFTDAEQELVGGSHPVFLAGVRNVIARPDLADRAVVLPLQPIEHRRSEIELMAAFEAERPAILGAILSAVAHGLRQLPNVRLQLPRMADYALWATACETEPGSFMAAFADSAAAATEGIVENEPVAIAIRALMSDRVVPWIGTISELMRELSQHDRAEAQPSTWRTWPRDAAAFAKSMRHLQGALRKTRIEITFDRAPDHRRTRIVTLHRVADKPDASDRPDRPSLPGNVIPIREPE
jgi:hypothetical protein